MKKTSASERHSDDCAMGINEKHVQEILAKTDKPMTAYDIIPVLSKKLKTTVAPTTVYRALNHLAAHGLVTRIESQNAYVLCQHPKENHDCLFFICRTCGSATEAPDNKISQMLRREAADIHFDISKQILEIVGICEDCARK